jgi:hypothetical protein
VIAAGASRDEPVTVYRFHPPDHACMVCREHAVHLWYRTWQAASDDRSHPGCECIVIGEHTDADTAARYFPGDRLAYDDREP